jgi:hypothetical protein
MGNWTTICVPESLRLTTEPDQPAGGAMRQRTAVRLVMYCSQTEGAADCCIEAAIMLNAKDDDMTFVLSLCARLLLGVELERERTL